LIRFGERVSHMVSQVEKILPGLKDHFEKGLAKCWDEDEWARGVDRHGMGRDA
jgi:monoamine oxidase